MTTYVLKQKFNSLELDYSLQDYIGVYSSETDFPAPRNIWIIKTRNKTNNVYIKASKITHLYRSCGMEFVLHAVQNLNL